MPSPIDIFEPNIDTITIEVTSKCNLRCSYCTKANKEWEAIPSNNKDMTNSMIDELYIHCLDNNIKNISLSGVGETALTAGWHLRLAKFLDDPYFNTHLVSNFVRIFSDDDIEALLKLNNIQISFDSANFDKVRKMRSKADLRTITYNIVRLAQRRREVGRGPQILVNCTLCRENIGDIVELASFCRQLGVDSLMVSEVMVLTVGDPNMPDTLNSLDESEIVLLVDQLVKAEEVLHGSPTGLDIRDRLRKRVEELVEQVREGSPLINPGDYFHRDLETAACRQPWSQPYVRSDGNVYPCCIGLDVKQSLGNLSEHSLAEIFAGPKARALRGKLLTSEGANICGGCTLAYGSSWDEFATDIRRWKGDTSAEAALESDLARERWVDLLGPGDYPVLVENCNYASDASQTTIQASQRYGLHRVMVDLPSAFASAEIRFTVQSAGCRRFRFDLADATKHMIGRAVVLLSSIPRISVEMGSVEISIERVKDSLYSIGLTILNDDQLGHFNISLMREDGALFYRGNNRSGIMISDFNITETHLDRLQ